MLTCASNEILHFIEFHTMIPREESGAVIVYSDGNYGKYRLRIELRQLVNCLRIFFYSLSFVILTAWVVGCDAKH